MSLFENITFDLVLPSMLEQVKHQSKLVYVCLWVVFKLAKLPLAKKVLFKLAVWYINKSLKVVNQ